MAVVAGRRESSDPGRNLPSSLPVPSLRVRRGGAREVRSVARAGPAAHFRYLATLADGLVLLAAFPVAYLVKTRLLPSDLTRLYDPEVYLGPAALVAVATLLCLGRQGAYDAISVLHVGRMLARVGAAVAQSLVVAATALFTFKLSYVSRLFVGLYGASAVSLLVAVRLALRSVALRRRAEGVGAARVLLIGGGESAERMRRVLEEEALFGIAVVAQLRPPLGAPVSELLAQEAIDEVAIAEGAFSREELAAFIEECDREGIAFHILADVLAPGFGGASFQQLGDGTLISVNPQVHSAWGRAVKRALDLVATPLLVVLTSPLWLIAAVAIKLDSPGPVFFVQERLGLNKRRFKLIKFRSMYHGSEHLRPMLHHFNEADGPIFKLRDDPRVTRVGRLLRRFDLDELPQLLNVLKGEMSLIGPRPMLPSEIAAFEPWQRKRFSMLPGITGLWQVSNRLGAPFLEGLATDLEYIDRWSLRLDFEIVVRTVPAILRDRVAP
jgi:exopolysaccharide biosynthesis polyprenyl glycosylphosphotransferase